MRHPRLAAAILAGCTLMTVLPATASAQGWLDRVKQKAKQTIQQRTDQATDSVTNAALDKAEHVVKCVVGDKQCIKNAQAAGQQVAVVNAQGQAVSTADSARAIAAAGATGSLATGGAPGAAANAAPTGVDPHNDFTPGTDVIFATNFANATLGDFPRDIELVRGNAEAVSWNGGKYLRATDGTVFRVKLPHVLPQRFTLEYDYTGSAGWDSHVTLAPDAPDNQPHGEVKCSTSGDGGVYPDKGAKSSSGIGDLSGQMIHCAIMADSDYVKVYINGQRVANSPNAPLGRSNVVEFYIVADKGSPAYIGNIRIAAGGRDMYQALSTEGRFTTHGINFATGSSAIDPTSATTLQQIGQMLQQHPDLKLEIDGHTDNVGSAASNMTLSDQRAAAVKQYLVSNFQVDASRLTSKGFGATKPIAPNTTDDGRAQNRRVELVKL